MKRISSKLTFFLKWVFPFLLFGLIAAFHIVLFVTGLAGRDPAFLWTLLVIGVAEVVFMKAFVWSLVDEVHDGGDWLLVRNRGGEERIPLTEILDVSDHSTLNPPRITLRLRRPCRFGGEIAFLPAMEVTLNPFARGQAAEELLMRVYEARAAQVGAQR